MKYYASGIINIGDPFVLRENSTYYMYATHSSEGISVWQGSSPETLGGKKLCYTKEKSFGDGCFWAPEVVKRKDGMYIMYFTARDRRDGVLRTGAAISDRPDGMFEDAYAGRPMFDVGCATIDATCLIDGGNAYLYYVKDCSRNVVGGINTSQIYAVRLTEDLLGITGEHVLAATPSQKWETQSLPAPCMGEAPKADGTKKYLWNEAPAVLKHCGKYYLTYSANCFDSRYYSVGCAVSDSPTGPFEKYADNPIMEYIEGEMSGPGHNSFFTDGEGNLMCAFHCHTDYDKPSGNRRFCCCKAEFDGEGKLKLNYR